MENSGKDNLDNGVEKVTKTETKRSTFGLFKKNINHVSTVNAATSVSSRSLYANILTAFNV